MNRPETSRFGFFSLEVGPCARVELGSDTAVLGESVSSRDAKRPSAVIC